MIGAITVGAGNIRPHGRRIALSGDTIAVALKAMLQGLPAEEESWWSPSTFKAGTVQGKDGPAERPCDYRHGELWEGSVAVVIDADHFDRAGDHAPLTAAARDEILKAIVAAEITAGLAHLTPRGARFIFPLDALATDPDAWRRAALGACELITKALPKFEDGHLEVDLPASTDRARFYYAPNAVVDGTRREATVFLIHDRVWSLEELARYTPAETAGPKPLPIEDGRIVQGDRHGSLTSLAATLSSRGIRGDALSAVLQAANQTLCVPPKDPTEIARIADYFTKKDAGKAAEGEAPDLERFSSIAIGMNTLLAMEVEKPISLLGDGIMSGFQVAMLVGIAGTGKTFVEEEFALSLVRGTPFYGLPTPAGGVNVGAVMLEGHVYNYKERLKALAVAHGGSRPEDERLKFISRPILKGSVMVLNASTRAALIHWIRTENLAVVIVDPLKNAHDCDENSNRDMGAVIAAFQSIADETGATFLIVHHESPKATSDGRKRPAMASPRGASRLVDDVRCLMLLSQTEGGLRRLSFPKVSYGRSPEPIYLLQDRETGIFEVTEPPEKQAARKSDRSREKLRSALLEAGRNGLTVSGLHEETGLSDSRIYDYLKELGAISNGATRQPRYRLPSEQSESSGNTQVDNATLFDGNALAGPSPKRSDSGENEPSGFRTVPYKGDGFGTESGTVSRRPDAPIKLVPPPKEPR